jgi:hypothetical protein
LENSISVGICCRGGKRETSSAKDPIRHFRFHIHPEAGDESTILSPPA